jgi:hypothetical protein
MYEDSKNYNFALKVDGKYYNVYRNENWWVSNDKTRGLDWAIPAYAFNSLVEWKIPFNTELVFAKWHNDYGFIYGFLEEKDDYLLEISPTKEMVESHYIEWTYY